MNKSRLLIIGAGGHGKVVGDCAQAAARWAEIVFYDRRWPLLTGCGPWRVAGTDMAVLDDWRSGDQVFVAIGEAVARMEWLERMQSAGLPIAVITHHRAVVSPETILGEGSFVAPSAVINIGTRLGRGCIINTGASIDHDCELGDGTHICPGVHLAGNVRVGAGSFIGIGSAVCHGVTIGAAVTVGAGSVVTADVPDGYTVVGVPARPLKRV